MPRERRPSLTSTPPTGVRIGYARVSTDDQNLSLQLDALTRIGCSVVYQEKESRKLKAAERPELTNALKALRAGDTLVVWKLDRLGGNLIDLITLIEALKDRGVEFQSLTESLDTSTATGQMFFEIVAVFAAFERNRLSERTKAGLAAARARGRKGGRRKALGEKALREIAALAKDPAITVKDICDRYGIGRSTYYAYFPGSSALPPPGAAEPR